jgi:tetratricopeptide (TPR) repeat protein
MYDPSPVMRPLLGVISFASDLPVKQLITNERVQNRLEGFAESAVGGLFRIVKASPYGAITWEQIRQDILNRLVPERFKPVKALSTVQDNSGVMWWEVKPGCFARENDIRNVLWFQERSFVGDKMDRWKPVGVYGEEVMSRVETADVKRYVEAGEFDKLYEIVDNLSNGELKAQKYHEAAMASMERDDRFNSLVAAQKYKEVRGESAKSYQLLGHIYWWFEDLDTAIGYSEKARELAENERDNTLTTAIKNNLAFYYAEKQVNKDQALKYVADIIDRTSPEAGVYAAYLDTAGYVYTRFATTTADIDEAVKYYVAALEHEPQKTDTNQHLREAFEKKKVLAR